MQFERLGLEAMTLGTEALDRPRRQVGIFVPCAECALPLKAVGERSTPLIVENALQGYPTTLDVLAIVIVARPRCVGGHGGVDPCARRQLVVDETAVGVAEGGNP